MRVRIDCRSSSLDVGRRPSISTLPAVPAKPRADCPSSKLKPGSRCDHVVGGVGPRVREEGGLVGEDAGSARVRGPRRSPRQRGASNANPTTVALLTYAKPSAVCLVGATGAPLPVAAPAHVEAFNETGYGGSLFACECHRAVHHRITALFGETTVVMLAEKVSVSVKRWMSPWVRHTGQPGAERAGVGVVAAAIRAQVENDYAGFAGSRSARGFAGNPKSSCRRCRCWTSTAPAICRIWERNLADRPVRVAEGDWY